MSRFKVLRANPRRSLAALATLLIAVGVTAASGANFTSASANPSNVFTAGTLHMDNSKAGIAILGASNMRPGDTTSGLVDIKNDGTLDAPFTLSKGAVTETGAFSTQLKLTIVDCGLWTTGPTPTAPTCDAGDTKIYENGTIAQMGNVAHPVAGLGTFISGDRHRYQFTVQLDPNADDTFQGKTADVTFNWAA